MREEGGDTGRNGDKGRCLTIDVIVLIILKLEHEVKLHTHMLLICSNLLVSSEGVLCCSVPCCCTLSLNFSSPEVTEILLLLIYNVLKCTKLRDGR